MENNNLNPSPVTAYQPPSDPISPTTTPPPSPVVANPTIPNTIPNPTAYSPVIPASQTPGVTPNPSTQVPLTPEPIPSLEQAPPIMPPPPQAPNQMINPPLAQSTGKPNGWKVGVIVAVVLLLVTGVVSAVKMNQSKDVSKSGTTTTNQAGANVNKIDEKKFQTDTDGDSLPDFIEKEWGYDPNSDDVLKCYENKCLDPSIQAGQIKKRNVVIILDSSGSMKANVGSVTKMEAAKKAIVSYVKGAEGAANIGLVVYGHKGSNAVADKPVSCAESDILAQLGQVNSTNIEQHLSSINPTGWTNIGLAINKAATMFTENEINEVMVLTDGGETCDTNPVGAAGALANSASKVTVNVIGFAVTGAESTSLQAISSAGKGTYSAANSAFELEDIFAKSRQNWANYMDAALCLNQSLTKLHDCTKEMQDKRTQYFDGINNLPKEQMSYTEKNLYGEVRTKFSKHLDDFFTSKSKEIADQKRAYSDKLDNPK